MEAKSHHKIRGKNKHPWIQVCSRNFWFLLLSSSLPLSHTPTLPQLPNPIFPCKILGLALSPSRPPHCLLANFIELPLNFMLSPSLCVSLIPRFSPHGYLMHGSTSTSTATLALGTLRQHNNSPTEHLCSLSPRGWGWHLTNNSLIHCWDSPPFGRHIPTLVAFSTQQTNTHITTITGMTCSPSPSFPSLLTFCTHKLLTHTHTHIQRTRKAHCVGIYQASSTHQNNNNNNNNNNKTHKHTQDDNKWQPPTSSSWRPMSISWTTRAWTWGAPAPFLPLPTTIMREGKEERRHRRQWRGTPWSHRTMSFTSLDWTTPPPISFSGFVSGMGWRWRVSRIRALSAWIPRRIAFSFRVVSFECV